MSTARSVRTALILATVTVAGGALLTACSSGSSSSDTASKVGGMTTCDDATLMSTLQKLDATNDYSNMSLSCADGWAALTVDQAPKSDAAHGINVTYVFQAEGQFWVPQDRAKVCGTIDANAPASRPADSQVPDAIWTVACNTN